MAFHRRFSVRLAGATTVAFGGYCSWYSNQSSATLVEEKSNSDPLVTTKASFVPKTREKMWDSIHRYCREFEEEKPISGEPTPEVAEPYDLVVIGGGLVGLYCALDAATRDIAEESPLHKGDDTITRQRRRNRRRLKVALFEAEDFGSGWSSLSFTQFLQPGYQFADRISTLMETELAKDVIDASMDVKNWSVLAPWALTPSETVVTCTSFYQAFLAHTLQKLCFKVLSTPFGGFFMPDLPSDSSEEGCTSSTSGTTTTTTTTTTNLLGQLIRHDSGLSWVPESLGLSLSGDTNELLAKNRLTAGDREKKEYAEFGVDHNSDGLTASTNERLNDLTGRDQSFLPKPWKTASVFRHTNAVSKADQLIIQLARLCEERGVDLVSRAKVTKLLHEEQEYNLARNQDAEQWDLNPISGNVGPQVCGVQVKDCLSHGKEMTVRAHQVINATGFEIDSVKGSLEGRAPDRLIGKGSIGNSMSTQDGDRSGDATRSRGFNLHSHLVVSKKSLEDCGLLPPSPTQRFHLRFLMFGLENSDLIIAPYHLKGGEKRSSQTDLYTVGPFVSAVTSNSDVKASRNDLSSLPVPATSLNLLGASDLLGKSRAVNIISAPTLNLRSEFHSSVIEEVARHERTIQMGTSGLLTAVGGNWTSARRFAEELVDLSCALQLAKEQNFDKYRHRLRVRDEKIKHLSSAERISLDKASSEADLVGGTREEDAASNYAPGFRVPGTSHYVTNPYHKYLRRTYQSIFRRTRSAEETTKEPPEGLSNFVLWSFIKNTKVPGLHHFKLKEARKQFNCQTLQLGIPPPIPSGLDGKSLNREQIRHLICSQYALTLKDVLKRRSNMLGVHLPMLGMDDSVARSIRGDVQQKRKRVKQLERVTEVAQWMAEELRWDKRRLKSEIQGVMRELDEMDSSVA